MLSEKLIDLTQKGFDIDSEPSNAVDFRMVIVLSKDDLKIRRGIAYGEFIKFSGNPDFIMETILTEMERQFNDRYNL